MRIVLVNHTFPPASWAGSEICVLRTAQELRRHGHEVLVFTRDGSIDREEYSIHEDEVEGVPVTRITKTFRYARTFDDIFRDDYLAARFGDWVGGVEPDLVHLHHLTNLSTTLTHELYIRGIPTVMTLHDFWLLCQRGQLLTRTLKRCDGPSVAGCRDCLAVQALRGKAQRLVGGLIARERRLTAGSTSSTDLVGRKADSVDTPKREFVQVLPIEIDGVENTALMMHPPSTARYVLNVGPAACLEVAYGMFPSTYDEVGDGVRFTIRVADDVVLNEFVDAKRIVESRRWFERSIDLGKWAGKTVDVVLTTAAEPSGNPNHTAAGWGKLRVIGANPMREEKANGSRWGSAAGPLLSWGLNACARAAAAAFPSATHAIQRRRLAVRNVLDEVDCFISPSEFLRDFFVGHGLKKSRITVLDNGFLPTERPAIGRTSGRVRFGYLGTWIPSKGVDLLVEAFNTLHDDAAELHIYGFFPGYDGHEDYEARLRKMAAHPGIVFHGRYDPDQVLELLAGLDVLVVPSIWWENSPLTIHEAFQAKVPVITADVGGMAEFVQHEAGGLQFRHRDVASLAEALQRIVNDPDLVERLRASIPRVLTIGEHVDLLLHLYGKVLNRKTHPWMLPVEF